MEIVDRIRCIFEELKKENIAFGLYVDSEGRYIEPDDPEFNSQYIYYSPKKLLGMYIDMLEINECRDGYIANILHR